MQAAGQTRPIPRFSTCCKSWRPLVGGRQLLRSRLPLCDCWLSPPPWEPARWGMRVWAPRAQARPGQARSQHRTWDGQPSSRRGAQRLPPQPSLLRTPTSWLQPGCNKEWQQRRQWLRQGSPGSRLRHCLSCSHLWLLVFSPACSRASSPTIHSSPSPCREPLLSSGHPRATSHHRTTRCQRGALRSSLEPRPKTSMHPLH